MSLVFVVESGADNSNTVHRHEPPITNDPVLVLHINEEKEFVVVSKPGSMVGFEASAVAGR